MPVTDINPNNSGTIKLGTVDPPTGEYQCQVISWVLNPVPNTTQRPGTFCSPPLTRNSASSWQVEFSYLQDWGATESISQFLFDNDGKLVYFEFEADVVGVPTASGAFYAVAGPFGGDASTSWQSTGTMALEGVPVFTADVPEVLAESDDDTDSE